MQGGGGEDGHLEEQLRRLQQRLVSRDAAAKKYKDGCRSLKERSEHLEQARPHVRGLRSVRAWRAASLQREVCVVGCGGRVVSVFARVLCAARGHAHGLRRRCSVRHRTVGGTASGPHAAAP